MTANTFTLVVRETTRHNAVDADILDEDGFIVPGLGDAGDRAFRTT